MSRFRVTRFKRVAFLHAQKCQMYSPRHTIPGALPRAKGNNWAFSPPKINEGAPIWHTLVKWGWANVADARIYVFRKAFYLSFFPNTEKWT